MKNFREILKVSQDEAEYINKLLSTEPIGEFDCFGEDETITHTAFFKNGYTMDIKVCGVQFEEGSCNEPWTEAVLFNSKQQQVAFTEPECDFFGEWTLEDVENDASYTVFVE
jgi:hypothetical protein